MPRQASSPHRTQRIAEQIQRDLSEIIAREIRDPALGMITLSEVQLSPDYAHARVFYSVLGGQPEQAQRVLDERAGYLHSVLYKRLRIHTVPTLHFVFDASTRDASSMNELIRRALADRARD